MSVAVSSDHPFQRALEGWRTTRAPRYAALVEALGAQQPERPLVGAGKRKADVEAWNALDDVGDPADLPRLIAALGAANSPVAAERITRLARRDDPRLVTGLLGLLEKPPYTGGTAKKFWQVLIAALVATRDPRAQEAMVSLSKRYQTINGTFMGEWVAGQLTRAAAKMKVADPLPAKALPALEQLEREVLGDVAKPAAPPALGRTLDDLFAQIVSHPDDDAARLVYADALLEEGDARRGELIVLQVARAAGNGTVASADRERDITWDDDLIDRMAVPLSAACDVVTFERGFPYAVHLKDKGLAQVVDAVEWGTIRAITGLERAPIKALLALFASGRLKNLVAVEVLTAARFAKLAPYAAPWTHVELEPDGMPEDALERMPALRKLFVTGHAAVSAKMFAGAPRLEELMLWNDATPLTPAILEALPALRRLTMRSGVMRVNAELAGRDWPVEQLKLYTTLDRVAPWLEVLPRVRVLELASDDALRTDGEFDWKALAALLATPRLDQLTVTRFRGAWTARFERAASGWTLVLPCANRWVGFYENLRDLAPSFKPCGVTHVILEPEEPRHLAEPFHDMKDVSLAELAEAWAPTPIETREVFRLASPAPDAHWPAVHEVRCRIR